MTVPFKVFLTPEAQRMLGRVTDIRIREKIRERVDGLVLDPDKQGKPLGGELAGYRSLRAVGQRFRMIYRIEQKKVIVVVIAIGLRKEGSRQDIYTLAQRLIRLKLI